jgi:hypothetical protein
VADFLRDVAAGQQPGPVLRDHRRVNAWNAAARGFLRSGESGAGAALDDRLGPQLVVHVRNDTGSDLPDFGVVTLSDSLLAGTDAEQSQRDTREGPILKGLLPAADTVIAVAQEPIRKDAIGRATVIGVTPCKLLVNAAGHLFARPVAGDATQLETATAGPAEIITKAAAPWAVVLLAGSGGAGGNNKVTCVSPIVTSVACVNNRLQYTWMYLRIDWANRTATLVDTCTPDPNPNVIPAAPGTATGGSTVVAIGSGAGVSGTGSAVGGSTTTATGSGAGVSGTGASSGSSTVTGTGAGSAAGVGTATGGSSATATGPSIG